MRLFRAVKRCQAFKQTFFFDGPTLMEPSQGLFMWQHWSRSSDSLGKEGDVYYIPCTLTVPTGPSAPPENGFMEGDYTSGVAPSQDSRVANKDF